MENHPISELFPLMVDGPEWDSFVDSVIQHGLRHPILLHRDGRILDGRNRYRACLQADVPYRTETFEGTDDEAIDLVVDENKHRRHLLPAQLAMVAARIADMKGGRPKTVSAETVSGRTSRAAAAKQVGASVGSVARARTVLKSGNEEVIKAVEQGKMPLRHALEKVRDRSIDSRRAIEKRNETRRLLSLVKDLPAGRMPEPRKPAAPQDIVTFLRRITRLIGNVLRNERYFKAIIRHKEFLAEDIRRESALTLRNFAHELLGFAEELYGEQNGKVLEGTRD